MPRTADQHLQEHILDAAQRLWRTKGEKGLTLRGVARLAGTTTTTVYKRFRNKEALRLALAERVYRQLAAEITSAAGLKDTYQRHLRFAENHPREYQLLFGPVWTKVFAPGRPQYITEWLVARLAEKFGGKPQDYMRLHYALFLVVHGAATLLAASPRNPANLEVHRTCLAVCDAMAENAQLFRKKSCR
ncbi:MAG TPA: TetR/AcrR family transcriptional regulator [Candidatus Angelobacter sp.]|nr:TetR/AcrR family transcriptional regulator [Candidatus Angelobacter sp.]